MPAKITVEALERSLPTSVAYRADRIKSFTAELDTDEWPVDVDAMKRGPGDASAKNTLEAIAKVRRCQLADLDDQEAMLRERYDMAVPDAPGERAARLLAAKRAQGNPTEAEVAQARADLAKPGGDFSTADNFVDKLRASPAYGAAPARLAEADAKAGLAPRWPEQTHYRVPPIADAPQQRTTPPPSALRDVQDGTIDEIRRVAGQLAELGEPPSDPPPSSEADGQALLKRLRARLYDLRQRGQQPAAPTAPKPAQTAATTPAPSVPGFKRPDGSEFQPGARVAAGERRCADPEHGARSPQAIDSKAWDDSQRLVGRPLCPHHLARARRAKEAK